MKKILMIALACMLIGCDGSKVVLSLAVVSDVHINTGVPMTSEKWTSALNQLAAKAAENDADGLDGVLVAGDLIDYPSERFLGEFKRVYEALWGKNGCIRNVDMIWITIKKLVFAWIIVRLIISVDISQVPGVIRV